MAAITVTASGVSAIVGNTIVDSGISNDTITAGQALYKDGANSNKLTRASSTSSLATSQAVGVSLHAALAGQIVNFATGGDMNFGSGLTANTALIVGTAAGAIAPIADLTTGWFLTLLGLATTTGILRLAIKTTGVSS